MPTIDRMVLTTLTDKVFTDDRVRKMLLLLQEERWQTGQEQQLFLKQLRGELEKNRQATGKLYEAVEKGLLPLNEMLTERAHKLEARRKEILTEMAGIRRESEMPKDLLSEKNVRVFCNALKKRLHDPGSGFGKQYLRLLVKDVRITGKKVQLRGSYEALAHTMVSGNVDTPEGVPTLGQTWRARPERIRTASEIPIEVDLTDEDAIPIYMKISEKVLHLRRLGMPYANICERLGVNRWMALRAARWAKAHQKARKS